jgi:hypothetical protein
MELVKYSNSYCKVLVSSNSIEKIYYLIFEILSSILSDTYPIGVRS